MRGRTRLLALLGSLRRSVGVEGIAPVKSAIPHGSAIIPEQDQNRASLGCRVKRPVRRMMTVIRATIEKRSSQTIGMALRAVPLRDRIHEERNIAKQKADQQHQHHPAVVNANRLFPVRNACWLLMVFIPRCYQSDIIPISPIRVKEEKVHGSFRDFES